MATKTETPSAPAFTPERGSKAERICGWFSTHPREVLTEQDIAEKFSVTQKRVAELLLECVLHKLLTRGLDFERDVTYQAGPALHVTYQHGESVAPADAPASSKRKGRTAAPALPDPAALVVRHGVPLPPSVTGRSPFAATFEAMAVGSSFLCSPEAVKGMHTRANSWGKANGGRKFSSRVLSATEAGIWRTA